MPYWEGGDRGVYGVEFMCGSGVFLKVEAALSVSHSFLCSHFCFQFCAPIFYIPVSLDLPVSSLPNHLHLPVFSNVPCGLERKCYLIQELLNRKWRSSAKTILTYPWCAQPSTQAQNLTLIRAATWRSESGPNESCHICKVFFQHGFPGNPFCKKTHCYRQMPAFV